MAIEAYKLMTYQCEKCGVEEIIWNSRDGVTPFMVRCNNLDCDGSMKHINWQADEFAPDYLPLKGQRVFITLPKELRVPVARRRVAGFDGTDYELQGREREAMVHDIEREIQPDEPMLITWPYGDPSK